MLKNYLYIVSIIALSTSLETYASELSCGKSEGEAGAKTIIDVYENFSVPDLASLPPESSEFKRYWLDIAEEAQEVHGNNYANRIYGTGILLRVKGRALIGPSNIPISQRKIRTFPNKTLYENITTEIGIKPDPEKVKQFQKDCEPVEEEHDNNDSNTGGGGGGSGSYYGGGSTPWAGTVYRRGTVIIHDDNK